MHPHVYEALVLKKSKTYTIKIAEADHYKMMCKDLRSELVSLLERLRLLRLQSFSKHIIVPEGWGHFHPVFFQKMTKNIKTVVNNILGKEVVEKNLKEEKDFKHLLFGENLSIFPGSLFLAPNDEIITRPLGKPLFPEFRDVEENIPPESIPFDIKVLRQDIYNYFNPPPPSVSEDDKIVNNMALTRSSDVLDKAHEDDAVLPPNTQAEESGLAQKVVEGIEGTKDATSVEDGGATQPPVNATSSNQPLHKDPPKPGISLHSSGSKADKPTLKDPPSNILGQTSPKGSKKKKKKSSDKLHESLTDEELKRKPPEEPYVPLTDEQLEDFFNELQKNPQNYRGGKHLRNFPDIEPNTTQTETDEDSDDPPHDPGAASVPGTPEASLQDSESEEIYEPEDVVAVEPKGSGKKKLSRRETRSQTSKKGALRTESPPAPTKKQRVGKFGTTSSRVRTKQKAKYSTGGDMTKSPGYRKLLADKKKREDARRAQAKAMKTPKSGSIGAARPATRKIVYEPIPKFVSKSATDHRKLALPITKLSEWRDSYDYNPYNYEVSQNNFDQTWKDFRKELELPDSKNQQRKIDQANSAEAKQKWAKHFAIKERSALEEACMHHVAGVAEIGWIPANLFNCFQKEPGTNKLLGKYVLKVQKLDKLKDEDYANCPTFEVHPDTKWVEDNIKPQYLATAQKLAVDFYRLLKPDGQKHEEQGYVDVSSLKINIPLDTDPINKLRYVPERTNKKGVVPAQWFGYCKKTNKKVLLDERYVNDQFPENLVADVKAFGEMGEKSSFQSLLVKPNHARPFLHSWLLGPQSNSSKRMIRIHV